MGPGGRNPYGCWHGSRSDGNTNPARGPRTWREKAEEEEEVEAVQPSATLEGRRLRFGAANAPEVAVPSGSAEPASLFELRERGEKSRPRASAGSRGSGRTALPVKTRGIMFGELLPIPTDLALDPPPKACYSCWHWVGHSCVRCPRPSSVFCHNCGQRGADYTVCPRCWAHRAYLKSRYGSDGPRLSASHRQGNVTTAAPETRSGPQDVTSRTEVPGRRVRRSQERPRTPVSPRRKVAALPGPVPAVAALAVARADRTCRTEKAHEAWRRESGPSVQQRSTQRPVTPRKPAVRSYLSRR